MRHDKTDKTQLLEGWTARTTLLKMIGRISLQKVRILLATGDLTGTTSNIPGQRFGPKFKTIFPD